MVTPPTFRCDKLSMTLTEPGCARLWKAAEEKRPEPWEARWHCRGCPIGARNAGVAAPAQQATVAGDALRLICARCARRGERMIEERHCVSCYNRHREAVAGRNGKGGVPRLLAKLHTEILATGGRPIVLEHVASRPEGIVLAAKRSAGQPVRIGRPPLMLRAPIGDLVARAGACAVPARPRQRRRVAPLRLLAISTATQLVLAL